MRPAAQARSLIETGYAKLFGREPPWPATRLLLAQSRGEGRWGELGGVDALGDPYGENWAGLQAKMGPPCPPGTFQHGDSKPTAAGQIPFQWCFVGYPPDDPEGPQKGVSDFLHHALIYRPKAGVAVLTGDSRRYAEALYGTGKAPYFGGFGKTIPERIQSYVDFLDSNAREVDRELGLAPPGKSSDEPGSEVQVRARGPLPFAVAALGLYYLLTKRS